MKTTAFQQGLDLRWADAEFGRGLNQITRVHGVPVAPRGACQSGDIEWLDGTRDPGEQVALRLLRERAARGCGQGLVATRAQFRSEVRMVLDQYLQ